MPSENLDLGAEIFFSCIEHCTVALVLLPAMQKYEPCFTVWLNLTASLWAQAISLDVGQTLRRLKKSRHTCTTTPLQAMKLLCWGSHKSSHTILLYLYRALFIDSNICQKGLCTTVEGVMPIPSGHRGIGYFWFTYCRSCLRSVSKQLSEILDDMFLINFLWSLQESGEWERS